MDAKRQGEIAIKLVEDQMRQGGIHFSPHYGRELGQLSARTGIPIAELQEFLRPIVMGILEQALGQNRQTRVGA